MADIGWAVGHGISIYGNLVSGGTELLFESLPTFPDPGRYWSMVEKYKINQFFSAPTAYRMLMQSGNDWVEKYDRSSLKTIMVAGEMCNEAAWWWLHDIVGEGRATVIDCWWQTETGNCMLTPSPGPVGERLAPSKCTRGFYGVDPVLVDEQGKEISANEKKGDLCIRHPVPGMARAIYKDKERFIKSYFKQYPGMYETGDAAIRDSNGRLQITGRVDDIINIAGHRISTKEIEEVVLSNKNVSEGAVISIPHEIKGETTVAFVVPLDTKMDSSSECKLKEALTADISLQIAKFAVPSAIYLVQALPVTRSGKLMRRILRSLAVDSDELGDTSTLVNPVSVEEIKKTIAQKPK